jgi:hypothetical protein
MTTALDVLLLESHPGVGDASARVLAEAGHRIHRCHHAGDAGYACVGMTGDAPCPIDGHVDAAVVVRAPGSEAPTPHEDGVRCAVRSHVPVVEVGEKDGDPYAGWVTLRSEERSLSAACTTAVQLARQPLIDAVLTRIAPLVRNAGLDPDAAACRIEVRWPDMDVEVLLPGPVDRRLEQAVGVRCYDALRADTASFRTVNVTTRTIPDLDA